MGRQRKNTTNTQSEAKETRTNRVPDRKFAGRRQKTDFNFLREMLPEKFGGMVFRLVTDDDGGANIYEKIDLGWETVKITKEDVKQNPRLARFMDDKESGEGSTVRIPVNKHNASLGVYAMLMMKSAEAFEAEERAALQHEVDMTEHALKRGSDQGESGLEDGVFYAPKVKGEKQGFDVEQKGSLI
jgi:hypothetical protein